MGFDYYDVALFIPDRSRSVRTRNQEEPYVMSCTMH